MALGSLPKVNLIREGIHERYQKKTQTETSSTPQDATLKPARCRKKYHHGMCTSPWWQLPEIALCSCATLRNTSNPVLETQPFPESSVEATHCRDPCWMAIQESHFRPRQTFQHCSGKADGPTRLSLSTGRKGIAVRKGGTELISCKHPHQQLLAVVATSWKETRDSVDCTVFTITPKITAKLFNKCQTLAWFSYLWQIKSNHLSWPFLGYRLWGRICFSPF